MRPCATPSTTRSSCSVPFTFETSPGYRRRSKAHLIQHVQGERDRRTERLEAHAAWASSKPTDALDALRRAVDGVTGAQRAKLEEAFNGVKDALNAAKRRADGVRDATTRASAAGYDAERGDLPASRRDACFDHPILHQHHGGPASNLAVAQHSPDPAARATPLLRIIPHRHELPSLLRDLGLDRVGAELGVWKGSYSRRLLSELPDLTLHLVDSWEPVDIYQSADKQDDAYAETLQAVEPYKERTRVHRNWTSDAAKTFEDQSLDFVYVDASHDYRNCRADLIDWWPKVKVGGLFAGNDYYTGHVAAAGVTFGVKDAVDEFAAVRNLRVYVTAGNDPDGCCPDWYVLKCGE